MKTTLRLLGAAVLCFALTPLTFAQDCSRIATSAGAVDMAYADCATDSAVEALRSGPSDLAFGHNASTSNIITFPQSAPETLTPIGTYAAPVFLNAGDFGANNMTWFGLDSGGQAISVNMMTGAVTVLGTIAAPGGESWTGLTYNPADGLFYATSAACGASSTFSTVNFGSLTSTTIGTLGAAATCAISVAADEDGTVYAVDIVLDQLVTINAGTGAATAVGPLGFDANFGQGMDIDRDNGDLYQYSFNATSFVPELRLTNKATGASTIVGIIGATVPGGLNQLGAASSKTLPAVGDPFTIDADPESQTVSAPGTASFTYQVCNNTNNAQSGVVFFEAFLGQNSVAGPTVVQSGTLQGNSCSPNLSFSVGVPGAAPAATYTVSISAGPSNGNAVATDDVSVTVVNPSATGTSTEWSVVDAQAWPTFEAAARTSEIGAYPNPFVDRTEIAYTLEEGAKVQLTVYDVLGREVAVLTDEVLEAGTHTATFDARGLATGTYIYRLVAGNEVQSGRITLMK